MLSHSRTNKAKNKYLPLVAQIINILCDGKEMGSGFGGLILALFINITLMSKQSQKRIIEINHAISGIYGDQIKITAVKINQSRKESLKRLDRKKKLAPVIHDELYSYLEKFPQEKMGLNQQFVKKKKAKLSDFEERYPYRCPSITHDQRSVLTLGAKEQLSSLSSLFRYKVEAIESESDD